MFRISNTRLLSGMFSTTNKMLSGASKLDGCSVCGMRNEHITEYMKALQSQRSEHGYLNNPKAFPKGKCKALRSDSFQWSGVCEIARQLDVYARVILPGMGVEIGETARVFLSAFLRESEKEGIADLTGDSGQLSIKTLKELDQEGAIKIDDIKTIIDIGGLDTSFVQNFDTHEKVVNDVNLLTPLLSNPSVKVEFLVGFAEEVLSKCSALTQENRSPVLFNMSNLLSVLPSNAAFDLICVIRSHMKLGDILSITNLDQQQFEDDKRLEIHPDPEKKGLKEVYKKQGSFYKTVVDLPKFNEQMQRNGFCALKSEPITITIKASEKIYSPGFFITAVFKAV